MKVYLNSKENVTGERPSQTMLKQRDSLIGFKEKEYLSFPCSLIGLCKGKVNVLIIQGQQRILKVESRHSEVGFFRQSCHPFLLR